MTDFARTEFQITSISAMSPRELVRRSTANLVRVMPTADIVWGDIIDGYIPIIATPTKFLHVHPEWPEEWLGIAPANLRGVRWVDIVHPADTAESVRTATALDSGELEQVGAWPNRYRKTNGTYQPLLWQAYINDGTGLIYCGARPPRDEERKDVDRVLWGRDRCFKCQQGGL